MNREPVFGVRWATRALSCAFYPILGLAGPVGGSDFVAALRNCHAVSRGGTVGGSSIRPGVGWDRTTPGGRVVAKERSRRYLRQGLGPAVGVASFVGIPLGLLAQSGERHIL